MTMCVRFEGEIIIMKSERLFEMLLYLMDKKSTTAAELSEHFHVSIRTIYRDIDALSNSGIPVYTTIGNQGGIHLMEHYVVNRTLLTEEDQKNILLALKSLQTLPFFSANSAINKIAPLFQDTDQWLKIDFSHWGDGGYLRNNFFQIIKECILSQKCISIEYANGKGDFTERIIEPIKLIFQQSEWYLYAFCQLKQEFRIFKLKRIAGMKKLNQRGDHSYLDYPDASITTSSPQLSHPINFTGLFKKNVAYRIFDILPTAKVEVVSEHEVKVTAVLDEDEWLYAFLLSFGADVKIINPPELNIKIKQLHTEAIS